MDKRKRKTNLGFPEGLAVPSPQMWPVVLLLAIARWIVTKGERGTRFWLRQTENIRGHLWHGFCNGWTSHNGNRRTFFST